MLLGGQSNRFSILADLCSAEIDRTAVKDNDRIVLRIRAAQYSRNAQQQLLRQKWFGNVIIRTKTQSGQFIGRFIFRCQEDHRHIGKSADLPKQRKTIPALSKIPSPSPTAEKPSSKPACTKPSCGRAHITASSRQRSAQCWAMSAASSSVRRRQTPCSWWQSPLQPFWRQPPSRWPRASQPQPSRCMPFPE